MVKRTENFREYLNLSKDLEHSQMHMVMGFALTLASILMFISYLFRRQETYSLWNILFGLCGLFIIYYTWKDRKKNKVRMAELKVKIGL